MKKFIIICGILMFPIVAKAQHAKSDTFFGLRLGEKYSMEYIVSAIGENGTYVALDVETLKIGEIDCSYSFFKDVRYNGRTYPSMILIFMPSGGELVAVNFTVKAEAIDESQAMSEIYEELKGELSKSYEMSYFPVSERPEVERLESISDDGLMVRFDKYTNDGVITQINVMYISLKASIAPNSSLPTLQDTFFGLKMGERQSVAGIKSALYNKGEFVEEEVDFYGKSILFKNVIFAGKKWDYATFSITEKGEFYNFYVYDSLDDLYLESKEAGQTYDLLKSRLDNKYGAAEEKDGGDSKNAVYYGNNNRLLILSNERNESKGGSYRRFVGLKYIQTEVYNRLSEISDDEL
ncbi:MAG: hypothetical protein NC115_07700 [Bacteroidales bacterium]|nr:hypothetical protein [Bacteroidales bacterium]